MQVSSAASSRRVWRARSAGRRRAVFAAISSLLASFVVAVLAQAAPAAALGSSCGSTINTIVCENSKPGVPSSVWYVGGSYGDIVGYGTSASVQPGESLPFKVNTPSTSWEIDIYRLGWYQGNGAREISVVSPSVSLPQQQSACAYDQGTGMTDCGNWLVSATWQVPADVVPGLYVANITRLDKPGENQFPFVVRSDSSHADIAVQVSDETWQAYNTYGGNNFYVGNFTGSSNGRAYKVSYNRPYLNSDTANFYNAEAPTIAWLERNGYDVTYLSGTDVTRNPALLTNHKVFVSNGHDEYWNAAQRTGVENARAAGVNMMFLSGNEMYWRTRFENSIDGSNTAYRTLVCYKDTQDNAHLDPVAPGTGTWADPVYSAGQAQNAVTGTLYKINGYRSDALTVPSTYAADRFWRNTAVASLQPGQTATFAAGTLGYEWDTDSENSARPAGAIDLSATTVTLPASPAQVLQDYGRIYGGGTVTHSLVLYRDQTSGALVFGAGTVQWSWGLDSSHLHPGPAADARIQQATVNVLADMGVQPTTLQSGLVTASQSTDQAGPTVTVTSPTAGQTVAAGSAVTISGQASDVGGVVARVEVSVDGGQTWHVATGTTNWTYSWSPLAIGAAAIKVRGSDDSANVGAVTTVNVNVGPQQCPCTIFGSASPTQSDSGEASAIEVGTKFVASVNGGVTGVRFYKSAANTGTHTGSLWTTSGQLLATGTFTGESASGWQTLTFGSPVPVHSGQVYVASYYAPNGHYAADGGYFTGTSRGIAPVIAPADGGSAGGNGVYKYAGGFPSSTFGGTGYWVDAVFSTSVSDTTPPTVAASTPASGATGVSTTGSVTATFSEAVDPASVTMSLTGPGATQVSGNVSTAANGVASTFSPSLPLAQNTSYTASVTASDLWGNAMVSPTTWAFTTGASASGSCPCNLFGSTVPTIADSGEAATVELGVKFSSSVSGFVTGVRFYKSAANGGTHTGSLWNAAGQQLATGTFTAESATGWQTLSFANPVPVSIGQVYVASYLTTTGHYAYTSGYFASSSFANGPLLAPSGANGVYRYGGGFPTGTYGSTNYWVDPVVDTAGADHTPPTVVATTPANGATGVAATSNVTATFSEAVTSSSLSFTVSTGGSAVAGATSLSADGKTATFNPTVNLPDGATVSASVSASDVAGNAMASAATFSFTTLPSSSCPCTIFRDTDVPTSIDSDAAAIELGVRWNSSVSGWVTGVRFYKVAGATGTHTGSLWTNTGALLATGTFTNETASGWQTLTFATPVQVSANTSYVASYYSPNGKYGYTSRYFATTGRTSGPLTAPQDGTPAGGNGVYKYGAGFPSGTYQSASYSADVTFSTVGP